MRRGTTLPFVLLICGLPGCGAGASRGDVAAAELQAQSERAEAMREHARLIELEARLSEMERRLASRARACDATDVPRAFGVQSSHDRPKVEPLRSEGDFLTEARVVAPPAGPSDARAAVLDTSPPPTPASDRERLEQLVEDLREYAFDPQSGLSLERRQALRVLLRRERQLDLMNPWGDR